MVGAFICIYFFKPAPAKTCDLCTVCQMSRYLVCLLGKYKKPQHRNCIRFLDVNVLAYGFSGFSPPLPQEIQSKLFILTDLPRTCDRDIYSTYINCGMFHRLL